MSVTGHAETGPTRAGFAVCDAIAGMTAAFAVSSALYQRTHTGRASSSTSPCWMRRCRFSRPTSPITRSAATCRASSATGRRAGCRRRTCSSARAATSCSPSTTTSSSSRWPRRSASPTCRRTTLRRLAGAACQRGCAARHHRGRCSPTADGKTWEARLTEADVPCSRVWTIPEIVAHPQLAHRDVLQRVETAYGELTFVGSGFRLAHGGGKIERAARACPDADAQEILEEGRLRRSRDRGAAPANGDDLQPVVGPRGRLTASAALRAP